MSITSVTASHASLAAELGLGTLQAVSQTLYTEPGGATVQLVNGFNGGSGGNSNFPTDENVMSAQHIVGAGGIEFNVLQINMEWFGNANISWVIRNVTKSQTFSGNRQLGSGGLSVRNVALGQTIVADAGDVLQFGFTTDQLPTTQVWRNTNDPDDEFTWLVAGINNPGLGLALTPAAKIHQVTTDADGTVWGVAWGTNTISDLTGGVPNNWTAI